VAQYEPTGQGFITNVVLGVVVREPVVPTQKPAAHMSVQEGVEKLPERDVEATPVACGTFTVPVHVEVQGYGASVKMIVPGVTPVPERVIPIRSLPDVTTVMTSVVLAVVIDPVTTVEVP
jgi:hypothetical protein